MIFAPDCDRGAAKDIAQRIFAKLSKQALPLAGVRVSVSIGIFVCDGASADFAHMYRDADAALRHARAEGKGRIGMLTPSSTEAFQTEVPPAVTIIEGADGEPWRLEAFESTARRNLRRQNLSGADVSRVNASMSAGDSSQEDKAGVTAANLPVDDADGFRL